jgi:hypothetical protein
MARFIFVIISFIGAAWQWTTLAEISFWSASPNLILAIVLAGAIFNHESSGTAWLVFLPALWLDLLGGHPFGIMTLGFWGAFYSVDFLAAYWFKKGDLPARISLLLIGISFFEISQVLLLKLAFFFNLTSGFSFDGGSFFLKLIASLLINGGLILALLWFFDKKLSRRPLNNFFK